MEVKSRLRGGPLFFSDSERRLDVGCSVLDCLSSSAMKNPGRWALGTRRIFRPFALCPFALCLFLCHQLEEHSYLHRQSAKSICQCLAESQNRKTERN